MSLCEKIKDCDRVIHVQQLGIPWVPPADFLMRTDEDMEDMFDGQVNYDMDETELS